MLYQGSTYYISTHPDREFWDQDFRTMREMGMNTVKHLVVWEDVETDDGVFDFSIIHELMTKTEEYGLDVILELRLKNRGFPWWFFEKYPDSIPITADGSWRASGACYNHPKYQEHSVRFVERTVEELKQYTCIRMWDIWNEPHLYAAGDMDANSPEKQQCYCKYCRAGFRTWVKANPQYEKTITGDGWQGNEFSSGFAARDYRYRLYFINEVMVNEACRLYDAVKIVDDRPIALHDVFVSPVGNIQGIGNDDWRLADCVDIYGVSGGGAVGNGTPWGKRYYYCNPLLMDETRSAANGKPWFLSEWHVNSGSFGLSRRIDRTFEEIKREYFEALARGSGGMVTWAYRTFANHFCMVDIQGRKTTTYKHMSTIGEKLREINHFDSKPIRPSNVGIVYDPLSVLKFWEEVGNTEFINMGYEGIYRYLYDSDLMTDFVHPLMVGDLSKYKTVFVPCPLYLSPEVRDALRDYVHDGGTIISEGLFSYLDGSAYSKAGCIPHGFDEVFGARVAQWSDPLPHNAETDLVLVDDTGRKVTMTYSHHYEILEPRTASVVLMSERGHTICTENQYGKGRAILCASLFSPHITPTRNAVVATAGSTIVKSVLDADADGTKNYELLDHLFARLGWRFNKPKGVRIDKFGDLEIVTNESGSDYLYRPLRARTEVFTEEPALPETGVIVPDKGTGVYI